MCRLARQFKTFLARQNEARTLRAMKDVELSDLGLSKPELNSLIGARTTTRLQLVEMAKNFGIEEADIDKHRWRALDIVHNCGQCKSARACFDFVAGTGRFDPDTCPNAEHYRELARQKDDAAQS